MMDRMLYSGVDEYGGDTHWDRWVVTERVAE